MAFDNPTRNRLQRLVSECRDLLTREFDAKLQELYGIYAGEGRVLDLEKLPHLDDEKLRVATLLRERIEHLASGGGGTPTAIGEAVKRVLREQAFTVLNRFAALRMAEERGIIVESVGGGLNSKGFKTFSEVAYSGLGTAYERYRVFLGCMFDEMAVDLGVLFDRQSPYGLLFPRENVLLELFERFNAPEVKPLWKEDETIGWIYQYFNDPAERKKMRDESAAPRNSRELAVRNQFFTPRYVVEFLTDNTLGRIWYEMTQGETKLRQQCRYLVRRPNEIFLKPGEAARDQVKPDNLPQQDLLKQPVHIPHRPTKDPRTILMLDPACGSMHFGIYAFDLFEVIYDEAWEMEEKLGADALSRPEGLKSLHDTYADKNAFLKDVPRLIIEHNLHGIDIDPRCAQIAGLSLWLRAQKAWKDMGLKPAERPAIKRSNIVCAEPMPGEKHLLREFVEREFQPTEQGVFLRLLEAIFDKMQLAGEAGSLLKIEEEIRAAIEEARTAWQKLHTRPAELFATAELNAVSRQPELDATAHLQPIPADFWETAEDRLLNALRHYAEQAENDGGFQRRLFAEDAARGFAFIDVCRKRYDVAVMNPPFGEWSAQYKAETKRAYPYSYNDILAAFVERGGLLLHPGGRIGAITSRTCFFLSSFTKWRDHVVLDRLQPELLVDLGHGVMDAAMVEAAAYVLHKPVSGGVSRPHLLCFRLLKDEEPAAPLASSVEALRAGQPAGNIFTADPVSFRQIPNAPFAYWVSERIRRLFAQLPSFEREERKVKQGLATADDFRFIRAAWETTALAVGDPVRIWFTFAKGGSYSPFYSDVFLMVNWGKGGAEIKHNLTERGTVRSNVWMLRDTELLYFLRPGLTWPRRTNGLSFRALPAGSIFADKGPVAFVADDSSDTLLGLLAIANSRPFALLISVQLARVELAQSFEVGLVQNTPVPQELSPELTRLARSAWSAKRRGDTANLTSHAFFLPALARAHASLAGNLGGWSAVLAEDASSLADLRCQIDDIAYRLYSICSEDRIAIEHILGNPASATTSDADETSSPEDEIEEGECAPSASTAAFVSELLDYGSCVDCILLCEARAPTDPDRRALLRLRGHCIFLSKHRTGKNQ